MSAWRIFSTAVTSISKEKNLTPTPESSERHKRPSPPSSAGTSVPELVPRLMLATRFFCLSMLLSRQGATYYDDISISRHPDSAGRGDCGHKGKSTICWIKSKFLCNDVGIDLGTMNTLVYVAEVGIVLSEPSIVAINTINNKVVAVGDEAKRMVGRTSRGIRTVRPMKDGVIADAEVTDEMLRHFIRRATGRFKIMQPRVLVAVPSGITDVETRAVLDSTRRAGAREVRLVPEPLAAAIGVELPVDEPTSA